MNQVLGKLEILMTRGKIGHSESERIRKKKKWSYEISQSSFRINTLLYIPSCSEGIFQFFLLK